MSDVLGKCKIYKIESQSDLDIMEYRTEGEALSSALNLAGINNDYYQVINEEMLDKALSIIGNDIKKLISDDRLVAPFIHFSAHGNDSGVGLSNGDFVDWINLRNKIDAVNSIIGTFKFEQNELALNYSYLNLSFSVCEGINAKKFKKV